MGIAPETAPAKTTLLTPNVGLSPRVPLSPAQYSDPSTLSVQLDSRESPTSPTSPEATVAAEPDAIGLTVLHEPSLERKADIIFVHGLGGSSRGTWTKDRDAETFWPLKFLPLEAVVQDARILTFGYHSKFKSGAGPNTLSILDFARHLLYDLKYSKPERDTEQGGLRMGERPIIFVVHSLGGLVVKQACLQGRNDSKYEAIVKAVSGIIFLSTPHRGTHLAEALNRVLQVSLVAKPKNFIAELSPVSQLLDALNEQFRHMAPRLELFSFYETRPTTVVKRTQLMILEKYTSVLGYPDEVSKPLDADHNSICKYGSRLDPSYISVRSALQSILGQARPMNRKDTASKTQMGPFEQLLAESKLAERDYNFFHSRWTKGTSSWILSEPVFLDWVSDSVSFEARLLCLQGSAATGKSVLSSFIIHHLVRLGHMCHYFFVRFDDNTKRSASTVLLALASQLARAVPAYASRLRQQMQSGFDFKRADARSTWKLLFQQCHFDQEIRAPLYWVIDGVDEAEEPAGLLDILAELQSAHLPLRVLITSRSTHAINRALQNLSMAFRVEISDVNSIQDDIKIYINMNMDMAGDDVYQQQVRTQILQKAKGNFLWVNLAIQSINQCQTRSDVLRVLDDLSSDMEVIYERMASAVPKQSVSSDPTLGERILQWATSSKRPLTVTELVDALQNNEVLDIERSIGQLCGGFVVVDQARVVTLIHETARAYLTQERNEANLIGLERKPTHDKLFARCMMLLMGPSLKNFVDRDKPPVLLEYASSAWFFHLAHGSFTDPKILFTLTAFFKGQQVLVWIHVVAKQRQLELLVAASRCLNTLALEFRKNADEVSLRQQGAPALLESWAADLTKLVGKFGSALLLKPEAIYKLIPPFCPHESILYRQYGQKEPKTLKVSGSDHKTWDDCLGRLSLQQGSTTSALLTIGDNIIILANIRKESYIHVFSSTTLEEKKRMTQSEYVHTIQVDAKGERLVSYGWKTTMIWNLGTGQCVKTVQNPKGRPRVLSLMFTGDSADVLASFDDRYIRSINIEDSSDSWQTLTTIVEESRDDTITILNAPLCAALSPEGDMIVFGYRGHPVTLWDLATSEYVRQCYIWSEKLHANDQVGRTLGEITRLAWHPFSGEVFGLQRDGLLFKWDTSEDDASHTVQARAHYLDVNKDGSLIATGDTLGTLKIFTSDDLTQIYQLSSQDHILDVAFSADSRRLLDVRGSYGNVWEPNVLTRIAASPKLSEHSGDNLSEHGSIANLDSLRTEHTFPGVDRITALATQERGHLYCYGTEDGVAYLCAVGEGRVLELQRSPSFMSVEEVAWSGDGQLLAIADLGRGITVRKISKGTSLETPWEASQLARTKVSTSSSNIEQLLFQPNTHRLLVTSSIGLLVMDIDEGQDHVVSLPPDMPKVRWTSHPTHHDYLLAFGTAAVYIFSWSCLQQVSMRTYVPPRLASHHDLAVPRDAHGRPLLGAEERIGRVLTLQGFPEAMLEIVQPTTTGPETKEYLILSLQAVPDPGAESAEPAPGEEADAVELTKVPYSLVPHEIVSRIREPLALLSRGKFMYLDVDRWVCTWHLPSFVWRNSVPRRQAGQGTAPEIDRHYFLPGDWVTADEARLCAVMANGVLVCPRNGDAATVQYSRPL